jgi:hypothetical protein
MEKYHGSLSPEPANLQSVAALHALLHRQRGANETFEDYERELGRVMRGIECELKAAELARYDVTTETIVVDGQVYRRCLVDEPKMYLTSSGPVTVPRSLFRPAGGGKAICPLELRAGVVGACTPLLARQVTFLMGHMPSTEAVAVFSEMGIEGPSASTCDRMPKLLNPVWEQHREHWEAELRAQEEVPGEATVLACSLDGVLVPDREAQQEAKALREQAEKQGLAKKACGPAGYREVGCGTVTLYAPPQDPTSKDADERCPQRLDTVRYARAPEYKKKTLTEELDAEVAAIMAVRPDLELVALADGAEENWRYFDGPRWTDATKIVDHGHASQHLKAALAVYDGDSVDGRAEYERLRIILRDKPGGVNQVIAELDRLDRKLRRQKRPRRRKLLAKERKYFRNQRERMNYASYQKRGLPIGSGVIEAACKTLASQRLKLSGMNWGDGKQPILTIRSLQQSNRWERGWALLAGAFRREVTAPTTVEIKPLDIAA